MQITCSPYTTLPVTNKETEAPSLSRDLSELLSSIRPPKQHLVTRLPAGPHSQGRTLCLQGYVNLLFWYQFFCGFSGSTMIDYWQLIFFNLFFTSLPPLVFGVLDKDVSMETLLALPELYKSGQNSEVRGSGRRGGDLQLLPWGGRGGVLGWRSCVLVTTLPLTSHVTRKHCSLLLACFSFAVEGDGPDQWVFFFSVIS